MADGANLATAYVKILPSMEGSEGIIKQSLGMELDSAADSAGNGLVSKLKGIIAKAGLGMAIGKAIQTGLSEGAALEQSVGGIETLFKGSADQMKQYAAEAYKTAGLSANQYMEQATSFAAGLISSTGGNTAEAAKVANKALMDMSDNANKMGTDMESITQTYQSLARGNYAMLDNLKLGRKSIAEYKPSENGETLSLAA